MSSEIDTMFAQMQDRLEARRQELLAIHGPSPSDGVCEDCAALILPEIGEDGWTVEKVCSECAEARQVRRRHMKALRLEVREERMTFEAFRPETSSQRRALEVVRAGGSAWLHGYPGCGKTHLCTAAAIASPGQRVQRWAALELMAALRKEARSADSDERTMRAVCECDLLILDDLDAARGTDFALEALHRIADARYRRDLRTLVTSNLDPRECAARIGARVHSRLVGLCEVVHVEGPDARRAR